MPHLIAWVESRNVSAAPIRRIFGRTRLEDPNTRVPEAMTETSMASGRDPHKGRSARHPSRRVAASRRTRPDRVHPAIERLPRKRARPSGAVWAPRERPCRDAHTPQREESLLFLVHDTGTTPLHPARTEFALAVALKLARDGPGTDITPVRVSFAHAEPDNIEEHRRFFHKRVQFAAGCDVNEPQRSRWRTSDVPSRCSAVGHYSAAARERSGGSRPGEPRV